MMLTALLLGLIGSATHCVGMCGGVMLLLGRGRAATGWSRLVLHAGRLTTYAGLGALAGALGYGVGAAAGVHHHGHAHDATPASALPGAGVWGGALALLAAIVAAYMALALLGRAPSPELLLAQLTRWWGRTARGLIGRSVSTCQALPKCLAREGLQTYLLGLFWGLLPCGLVLAALLVAAATGSPMRAAGTMLLFGLGTAPLGVGIGWAGGRLRPGPRWAGRLRPLAAGLVLLFGVQMALRGLAAWGWVAHGSIGALPLW